MEGMAALSEKVSGTEYFRRLIRVGCSLAQLQSLTDQPHYLDGFEVLYRSLLPASSDWAAKRVALPSFQAPVGPLKRGYKYEFKVRPYGSNLYGRESNTRHLRVPETGEKRSASGIFDFLDCTAMFRGQQRTPPLPLYSVPSAPPMAVSITVSHEQNDTIHLSWGPPPHETHNGLIQGYQVRSTAP